MKIDARPPSVTEKAARGTLGEHRILIILSKFWVSKILLFKLCSKKNGR